MRVNKIYTHKDLSNFKNLLPDNSGVFIIADKNLSGYFKYFDGYKIISINSLEKEKTLQTAEKIITELLDFGADRNCFIVGFGGGIITDITGFVASIYKRGVRFGLIPTTLLSQVDASIGGKNGVNLNSYKNIIGTITQPMWIYQTLEVLQTLPLREFKAGIAEILKTFIIFDKNFYQKSLSSLEYIISNYESEKYKMCQLYSNTEYSISNCYSNKYQVENSSLECLHSRLESSITACASYKCQIVKKDEKENGERRLLNLGHTFGHAIEKLYGDKILHGEAVSIGIVIAAKISVSLKLAQPELANTLINDFRAVGLPAQLSDFNISLQNIKENLMDAICKDKKAEGDKIHLILPKEIGNAEDILISLNDLKEVVNDLC